jgi:geranylgeranyl pyrophosphate synthase
MQRLVRSIRESDATVKSMQEAQTFTHKALDILKAAPAGPERQALEDLTGYIVSRSI